MGRGVGSIPSPSVIVSPPVRVDVPGSSRSCGAMNVDTFPMKDMNHDIRVRGVTSFLGITRQEFIPQTTDIDHTLGASK